MRDTSRRTLREQHQSRPRSVVYTSDRVWPPSPDLRQRAAHDKYGAGARYCPRPGGCSLLEAAGREERPCTPRSGRERGVDAKHFREADLVAGEATGAAEAVAPDLLGIARTVDTLVTDRLEERGLKREREDVQDAPLRCQPLHGGDDVTAEAIPLRLSGNRDRGDFSHGGRILLERAAGQDPSARIDGDEEIVDRQRDLLRRAPQHQLLGGENVVQPRDLGRLRFTRRSNEQMLIVRRGHSTCSKTSRPMANSSRVVTSGGSSRTVHSPAVHVRRPASRAASTTCDAVPMMSIPHMYPRPRTARTRPVRRAISSSCRPIHAPFS